MYSIAMNDRRLVLCGMALLSAAASPRAAGPRCCGIAPVGRLAIARSPKK